MRVVQGIKEITAFITTTALSCGLSQFFGAIKLIVDTGLLFSNLVKARKISKAIEQINKKPSDFKNIVMINTIAKRLKIQKEDLSIEAVNKYLAAHRKKTEAKTTRLYRSLKADVCALIPLIGAHISWRIATEYKGKSFTPVFSRGIQHLLENAPKLASKPFFSDAYRNYPGNLKIPVNTFLKNRDIEAEFWAGKEIKDIDNFHKDKDKFYEESISENPTVVLFHPKGLTWTSMRHEMKIYRELGFNALSITMGGYDGSPDVTTSEASIYQDIEAVKQFLKSKGAKEVAWHGYSMGTGLALHAAADMNPEGLKTLFAVADKPYNSAAGVAGNTLRSLAEFFLPRFERSALAEGVVAGAGNILAPLAEGVLRAGLPGDRSVELPGGREILTDGLDNLKKAEKLKKLNIPLVCLMGARDSLMARNKVGDYYNDNFAEDILKKRYAKDDWKQFRICENSTHGRNGEERKALCSLLFNQKLVPEKGVQLMNQDKVILLEKFESWSNIMWAGGD